MNLVLFLENEFQELTLKNQTKTDSFSIQVDSEIKAIHQILTSYRTFLKWILIPKIFANFCLVNLKLKNPPEPVLLNKMKKEKEEKESKTKEQWEASNVVNINASAGTLAAVSPEPLEDKKQ